MQKKDNGILKYGTRGYAPAKHRPRRRDCSCFKSLRLRDDPYELMLLQQKLHKLLQDSASGRKAASSSSGNKNRLGLKAGYPLLMTL
jgi:hypothetical protein